MTGYAAGSRVLWTATVDVLAASRDVNAPGKVTGVQVNPPGTLAAADPPVTVYYVSLDDGRQVTAEPSQLKPMPPLDLLPYLWRNDTTTTTGRKRKENR